MSFWSSVDSFFKKIDADIAKAFGATQTWGPRVAGVIAMVAPILSSILTLTNGPAAATVNGVISQALGDLAAVNALATTAGGSQATVISTLNAVKSNLAQLLTAADVKNAATAAQITNAVTTVVNEIDAIAAAFPTA